MPGGTRRCALLMAATLVYAVPVAACGVTGSTGASGSVRGSGRAATQTRAVATFARIDLAGANDVTVHVGRSQRVVVKGDDNLLRLVVTTVSGDLLTIGARSGFRTRSPMSVDVDVPVLRGVGLSGAGEVRVDGVAADAFCAEVTGTGQLVVRGRADRLEASLRGTGQLDLGALTARDVTALVAGTGDVLVSASGALSARVSGTGSIRYTGGPATVTKDVTGTGAIVAD